MTPNPFPLDLWGYVHGFGYQTEGSIAPLAHYNPLKSISYAPDDNIIRYVFCMSLPEQDTTRKGRGYKNAMQMLRKCNAAEVRRHTRMLHKECRAKPCHRTLVVTPLRLEVLRVLRKLEYKLSRKDYLQINAFPIWWWWSERVSSHSTKECHWRSHE